MYKFNYIIGHYWESIGGAIGSYNIFGEVHYGTQKDAESSLEYVKSKNSDRDWRIFKIDESLDNPK